MNSPHPVSFARVIAIDGPEASGKSSVSRALARKLEGFRHLDSGSLYRTITYIALTYGADVTDSAYIIDIAERNHHRITVREGITRLDGVPVGQEIRTREISKKTSIISEIPMVRELIMGIQRGCINDIGLVAEGRDMTSVVFTDAALKIYLTASPQERARRRFEERRLKGELITYEKALEDLLERDSRDMNRACCPLKQVSDAILVDTEGKHEVEVVKLIEGYWFTKLSILDRFKAVA